MNLNWNWNCFMKFWDIINIFDLTPIIKTVSLCQVNIEQITFWDSGAWSLLVNGKQKGAIKSFFPRAFRHWKKNPQKWIGIHNLDQNQIFLYCRLFKRRSKSEWILGVRELRDTLFIWKSDGLLLTLSHMSSHNCEAGLKDEQIRTSARNWDEYILSSHTVCQPLKSKTFSRRRRLFVQLTVMFLKEQQKRDKNSSFRTFSSR